MKKLIFKKDLIKEEIKKIYVNEFIFYQNVFQMEN